MAGSAVPSADIEVQGPDGQSFTFPAGTDPEEMKGALDKHYASTQYAPSDRQAGAMNAGARGFVEGIPVLGAPALAGIDALDARVRAYTNGTDLATEQAKAQTYDQKLGTEHPYARTAGNVAGAVAGTAPLILAAPEAFGAGAGGIIARMAASGASGAALGGADAGVRSAMKPDASLGGVATDAGVGAVTGGTLGVAGPVVGGAVGNGVSKFYQMLRDATAPASGFGSSATKALGQEIANSGGVDAIRQSLGPLGADARLIDASDSLRAAGQALAPKPDTMPLITQPLRDRAAGTTARLAADVESNFGPAISPETATAGYRNLRQIPNQAIGDAVRSAGPIDTTDVLTNLADRLRTAEGPQRAALIHARDMLMPPQPGTGGMHQAPVRAPQTSAENLQNAKVALSGLMEHGNDPLGIPKGSVAQREGALAATVGDLNRALRDQVPGYASANDVSSGIARRIDAIQAGTDLLAGGKAATNPQNLRGQLAGMTPEEIRAMGVGTRGEIDRAVGTKRNDLLALENLMQGEGGWNAQNLAQIHGQEPVDALQQALQRERQFAYTNNKVVEGSRTAPTLEAGKRYAVRGENAADGEGASIKGIAGLKNMAYGKALQTLQGIGAQAQREADIARNVGVARGIMLQPGEQLDQLLNAVQARAANAQRARQLAPLVSAPVQGALEGQHNTLDPYTRALLGRAGTFVPALPAPR